MSSRKPLYIAYAGPTLLETPLLNKGAAFTEQERRTFNLMGLLPPRYETIEGQVERAYMQYRSFDEPINKHIYLRAVHDTNETLFYRLISEHLVEMLPIIYTPTVGDACEHFSAIYRSARGIFVSYEEREHMSDIMHSVSKDKVKVIVVTDGERVLGLGDQGIGGMGITIGKLSLYTACGGISPAYTLPVALDVGTNNQTLLDDPMYMGMRHPRVTGEEYHAFIDSFIKAAQERWPGVLIQFEDFAQPNAMPILQRHRDRVCCFNDDIQGTAAVTLGTLLAACRKKGEKLSAQRIVFVGAGSAGCGIAELVISAMVAEGLSDAQARAQVFMVDRFGLLTVGMQNLMDFQQRLMHHGATMTGWVLAEAKAQEMEDRKSREDRKNREDRQDEQDRQDGRDSQDSQDKERSLYATLFDVINNVRASVLIGVSGKPGLFTEQVVRRMHENCPRPIILPLSNPSRQVEAHPAQVLAWTEGRAIVATGSPFGNVEYQGKTYAIAQCNNSYIFPGIGLGVIACKSARVTDEMLMTASITLSENAPQVEDDTASILPPLTDLPQISRRIAFAVAKMAMSQGHAAEIPDQELLESIERNFWTPAYREYRRIAARAR